MADAPAGGSSWGPFEVVLVLLLVIAIFSNLGSNKTKSVLPITEPKKVTIKPVNTTGNTCGLSITAPLSLEKVHGSVRLSGSVNGCKWNPDGDTALFAQIINGSGVPVSDFITVTNNNSNFLNTSFDTTIYLNGNQVSGTGYLILIPAIQQGGDPITVRVPLRFVQN
jgi:hypothetical protein